MLSFGENLLIYLNRLVDSPLPREAAGVRDCPRGGGPRGGNQRQQSVRDGALGDAYRMPPDLRRYLRLLKHHRVCARSEGLEYRKAEPLLPGEMEVCHEPRQV